MIKEFENEYWNNNTQVLAFRHTSAINIMKDLKVDNFLDIGSWDGFFIDLVKKELKIEWEWFELSDAGIVNAEKNGIKLMQVDILSTENITEYSECYDMVSCLDVLEHILEPQNAIKNIHTITKKYLIISVPNFNSITARLQVLAWLVPENNTPKKGHCYWFNYDVINTLMEQNGFRVIRVESNTLWVLNKVWLWRILLKVFPWLFALSFTVLCEKI